MDRCSDIIDRRKWKRCDCCPHDKKVFDRVQPLSKQCPVVGGTRRRLDDSSSDDEKIKGTNNLSHFIGSIPLGFSTRVPLLSTQ